MTPLEYLHVDVFSKTPYSGNSLPVFMNTPDLTGGQMLEITQELRHFETIFLQPTEIPNRFSARVFDLLEELPFAGHPVIGAAAGLHYLSGDKSPQTQEFAMADKTVSVTTESSGGCFFGLLDQGSAEFLGEVSDLSTFAHAYSLEVSDLNPTLPLEVVSTGLRYLIVPVKSGVLEKARIAHDLTACLKDVGAQFGVLFDETGVEVRHWNNDGIVEDIATGSAAGTIGAYRLKHGLVEAGKTFILNQGRFTGRPSHLRVEPVGIPSDVHTVKVGGDVAIVGRGFLDVLPKI